MDSEIPELHCHLHTFLGLYSIGHNFETSVAAGVSLVNIRLSPSSTSDQRSLKFQRLITSEAKV